MLYLYLAGNKDGFDLAFSPKAVEAQLGMPQSTCRDQFKKLVSLGYLVQKKEGSNVYDFYEIPQKTENNFLSEETDAVQFTTPVEEARFTF